MRIYKNTSQENMPKNATIVTRKGQKYARYRQRGGAFVEFLILPNGKMRADSLTYYARILHYGERIRRPVNLRLTDKISALTKALQLQEDEERKHVGRVTNREKQDSHRPLIGCPKDLPKRMHIRNRRGEITEYAAAQSERDLQDAVTDSLLGDLLSSRGNKFNRANTLVMIRRIREICISCGFLTANDLDASRLEQYLAGLQRRVSKQTNRPLSPRSIKIRFVYLKAFTRFLVLRSVLKSCPFIAIGRVTDAKVADPRPRREFTDVEFDAMVIAAEKGESIEGVSGRQRATIYQFARSTGIRKNEIAELKVSDIVIGNESWVRLPAIVTKNARYDELPLDPNILDGIDIVKVMTDWVASRDPEGMLFDLKTLRGRNRKTCKMVEKDCANAEPVVEHQTRFGFVDFHSIRVSFENHLRKLGLDLELRRVLMRHRSISTTVGYGRVRSGEKAEKLSAALREAGRAQGKTEE